MAATSGTIRIGVACSPTAGDAVEITLEVPAGATVADAIAASGFALRHPELAAAAPSLGIWGRHVDARTVLAEGDRVEWYRPLSVDPKEARRLRAPGRQRRR